MFIIFDSNAVCHQAKHALKGLQSEEQQVGVIYGFLKQIISLAEKYDTNKFVFAWDSKRSFRKGIYSQYKKSRVEKRTEEDRKLNEISFPQFDLLREQILPSIGFKNNFRYAGLEGDDLVASIVQNNNSNKFLIFSSDNDLFQLLSSSVSMLKLKKKTLYTEKDFEKEWGIPPSYWAEVKAIAGCNGDEVPGVKGVGQKTACKFLLNTLPKSHKTYQAIMSDEGKDIIWRNKILVKLPYKRTPNIELTTKESLSLNAFISVCKEYGFISLIKEEGLIKWKRYLGMLHRL